MMQHDNSIRLRHMLDHAREAVRMTKGRNRADLDENRMLELALVRLIEIIGEASTRIDQDIKDSLDNIPWRQVSGMRNRLIHGYDAVDLDVLWDVIQLDLPKLIVHLSQALSEK